MFNTFTVPVSHFGYGYFSKLNVQNMKHNMVLNLFLPWKISNYQNYVWYFHFLFYFDHVSDTNTWLINCVSFYKTLNKIRLHNQISLTKKKKKNIYLQATLRFYTIYNVSHLMHIFYGNWWRDIIRSYHTIQVTSTLCYSIISLAS